MEDWTESTDDDDALEATPGKQLLMSLSVAMFFIVFLGGVTVAALSPEATFSLGTRGSSSRIPLTREQGLAVFLGLISLPALVIGAAVWASVRRAWQSAEPKAVAPAIPLSETVLWIGRPGWRSFRGPRIVGTLAAVLVPTGFLRWVFAVLTDGRPLMDKLPGLLLPSFLFFLSVLPCLIQSSGVIAMWLYDMLGPIAVTRNRIVWLTPLKRRIYRQIVGADVVDAFLTASEDGRGSITLVKRVKDDVEHVYIDGLPEPEQVHAAIHSLIRYRMPQPA